MSKIHTTVRVGVDGSLTLPAFFMRGMGYEPGEEVPITTPANQYICDCDANRLLVTRTCDDAECTGYTSSGMELNLPAALLSEASIPVGEEVAVLAADGALIIVPSTEELRELSVELCCLLNELGISPLTRPTDLGKLRSGMQVSTPMYPVRGTSKPSSASMATAAAH